MNREKIENQLFISVQRQLSQAQPEYIITRRALALILRARVNTSLSFMQKRAILNRLSTLARGMLETNSEKAIRQFCRDSIDLIIQGTKTEEASINKEKAVRHLTSFLANHENRNAIVQKTANILFGEKKVSRNQSSTARFQVGVYLNSDKTLRSILHHASPFHPTVLKRVLGEKLYAQFRPLGYTNKKMTTVLISVRSSAFVHQGFLCKADLLNRLRQIPELKNIHDLSFKVASSSLG